MLQQYPKSEVGFQHPSQEAGETCSKCVHFEVLRHQGCERVTGTILPTDYCKRFYQPKSRIAAAMKPKEK